MTLRRATIGELYPATLVEGELMIHVCVKTLAEASMVQRDLPDRAEECAVAVLLECPILV
jgi:hypothetical protein